MIDYSYQKKEKLKSKREIAALFEKGKWLTCGKIRIISIDLAKKPVPDLEVSNQKFGVSVAKKKFKKAVDRNRIKRLLRESYRLNKTVFLEKFGEKSLNMLFWVSNEKPKNYQEVCEAFLALCAAKK